MKFYYKEKLIRTSKTHEYKYAVINIKTGKCVTCSAKREGCEAYIRTAINDYMIKVQNSRNLLAALERGADHFDSTFKGKTYRTKIDKSYSFHTAAAAEENIQETLATIDHIKNNWLLVELEAKA